MRVSAKADYAVRAAVEMACAEGRPLKRDRMAEAQSIPVKFLENILSELRYAGLVRSQRGSEGGYWLARPATEIAVADVLRAVEGPLATVHDERPEEIDYVGHSESLRDVWIALRSSIRTVLETVSIAQIAAGELPPAIVELTEGPEDWVGR